MNSVNYTQKTAKNARSVLAWSFLWGCSLVLACAALKLWWPNNNAILAMFAVVHVGCAFGALKAHQVWLKELDELQQKIQLHSMAFTLGFTWVGITLLILLSCTGTLQLTQLQLPILAVTMTLVGALATLISKRRAS